MAKLYFYYSAMNAGKTTTLLQSDYNYRERGMNTLLLTAQLDHRDEVGMISSRIGLKRPAEVFFPRLNLWTLISDKHQAQPLHCVLVDEAQFLTSLQVQALAKVADELGIPVLAYGIRTDFQGQLFPGSQALLGLAEELIEIKTICPCGRKATMNMRLDATGQPITTGDQVAIGGNESYLAMCRRCFMERTTTNAQPELT